VAATCENEWAHLHNSGILNRYSPRPKISHGSVYELARAGIEVNPISEDNSLHYQEG
jgi:hypothetical protein